MNLFQKTSRSYLLFSAILLLAGGSLLYSILTGIIEDEITEKLQANKERITKRLEQGKAVVQLPPVIEVEELFRPLPRSLIIKDTTLYDTLEQESQPFREVTSIETINDTCYRITLRQVILESHDYYDSIGLVLVIVMAAMFIGLVLINKRISLKLWAPFNRNLEALKAFSLRQEQPILLQSSDISEFEELNEAIEKLTGKVRADYHSLKEFSENASHEMQTPLAVIQTKLEEVLQSPNLSDVQVNQIRSAYVSTQRLSRINKTLLLLTKIENGQFTATERVSIADAIEHQLQYFEDFIRAKSLSIEKQFEADAVVHGNPLLIETLLSNLIGNSVRHNIDNGRITIVSQVKSLTISNTGKPVSIPPEKMFDRFTKADPSSESVGLGLAIVKTICEVSSWQISYIIRNDWHTLRIDL